MGLKFKAWLAENAITQREIARLLGKSPKAINLKVNGTTPFTVAEIQKIKNVAALGELTEEERVEFYRSLTIISNSLDAVARR
jgi:transcriptional regulator with XRE-family HTH domain